jgi:hypothetical protein
MEASDEELVDSFKKVAANFPQMRICRMEEDIFLLTARHNESKFYTNGKLLERLTRRSWLRC